MHNLGRKSSVSVRDWLCSVSELVIRVGTLDIWIVSSRNWFQLDFLAESTRVCMSMRRVADEHLLWVNDCSWPVSADHEMESTHAYRLSVLPFHSSCYRTSPSPLPNTSTDVRIELVGFTFRSQWLESLLFSNVRLSDLDFSQICFICSCLHLL